MIKNFKAFTESISINQYKEYSGDFDRERYKDLFTKYKNLYKDVIPEKFYKGVNKDIFRLYLPYKNIQKSPTQLEVENILKKNGADLNTLDYINGTVKFPDSKNTVKIGKILNKLKKSDLSDKFASDKTRTTKEIFDYIICISRHPFDVVGADTDKRWVNCMTLAHYNRFRDSFFRDGASVDHLKSDVKEGTLVAFLIKMSEINGDPIKDSYSNINIKTYYNTDDPKDFVLVPDNRIYGIPDGRFKEIVFDWCEEVNGKKEGYYKLSNDLYLDNFKRADANKDQQFKDEEDETWSNYAKKYLPSKPDISKADPMDIDVG